MVTKQQAAPSIPKSLEFRTTRSVGACYRHLQDVLTEIRKSDTRDRVLEKEIAECVMKLKKVASALPNLEVR